MSALVAEAIDEAVAELVPLVGAKAACAAVGVPRASYYRAVATDPADNLADQDATEPAAPPELPAPQPSAQPRALSYQERAAVLEVLRCERFADTAPATVYATLLDEGSYLCSESTMYRLLRQRGETGDGRRHATHPATVKPELVASGPNTVWSWDITKLHGPAKWTYYGSVALSDRAAWLNDRPPVGQVASVSSTKAAGSRRCAGASVAMS